jgi:hypothetical protein
MITASLWILMLNAAVGYQLIDSAVKGDGKKTEVDFNEIIESAQIGAVFGLFPQAAIPFAVLGIKSTVENIVNDVKGGNLATAAFDIFTSIAPLISKGNREKASKTVNYLLGGEDYKPSFLNSITAEESSSLSQIRQTIIEAKGILNNNFK